MRSSPDRGFTLGELLVAVALLVVLAGATLAYFFPSLRDNTRTQVRMDLQRQATSASSKLIADLESCNPAGVGLNNTTVGLQPIVDITSESPPAPVYAPSLVVYWWDGQKKLFRWQGVSPQIQLSTSHPHRCPAEELKLLATESPQAVAVCSDVKSFRLHSPSALPAVGLPLTLELEVERTVSRSAERYQIRRTLSLRMAE